MAKYFNQGTFTTETNRADQIRVAMYNAFSGAITAGKTQWSIPQHGAILGSYERTTFQYLSGGQEFYIQAGNHATSTTDHTFNIFIAKRHMPQTDRIFTVTAATQTGTSPNFVHTYTTSVNHDIKVGEVVTITNVGTNFNRTNAIVTSIPAANQFTLTNTVSATNVSGITGTVQDAGVFSVTNATGNGTTVTYTFTNPSNFKFNIGETITVSNMNPSTYNLTGVVTASTTTTVSIASSVTGTFVSGGGVGFSTTGNGGGLFQIGFQRYTNETANSSGYNTLNLNFSTTSTNSDHSNQLTVPGTPTNWFIVVDDDYAIFSIKIGTAGYAWYFGNFESLVANPSLTDSDTACLAQNFSGNNTFFWGCAPLFSLNNASKVMNHALRPVAPFGNFTGNPAVSTNYDIYSGTSTTIPLSTVELVRENTLLSSTTNPAPNTGGWRRGRLKGILTSLSFSGVAWGDEITVGGKKYLFAGAVGANTQPGWWVEVD